MERKSIKLHKSTYEELDQIRSPGQSFNGAVQELIQKHSKKVKQ